MLTQCHTLPEMLFPFLPACKISLFGLFFSQSMFFCRCFFESIKDLYIQASGPTLCLEVEVMRRRQIVISYVSTTHCNTQQTTHNVSTTHCNSAQYVTTLFVLAYQHTVKCECSECNSTCCLRNILFSRLSQEHMTLCIFNTLKSQNATMPSQNTSGWYLGELSRAVGVGGERSIGWGALGNDILD